MRNGEPKAPKATARPSSILHSAFIILHSRRGSVLILIVALLVLMALAGTAFLVTTRTDRYAARQHVVNVQADMAVQSAVNMVVAELSSDVFGPNGDRVFNFAKPYRPSSPEGDTVPPFENWDELGDALVASRVPVLMNTQRNAPVDSLYPVTPNRALFPFDPRGINPPVWLVLSWWPKLPQNLEPDPTVVAGSIFAPTARPYLGQPLWPHLQGYVGGLPYDSDPTTPGVIDPVPAADADGDGIADALLWKLPMGPMNGVTYYAAVRVIDNNSAVNANTALARDSDFNGDAGPLAIPPYFAGRVGLAEMLRTYPGRNGSNPPAFTRLGPEMEALNRHRFNTDQRLRVAGVHGVAGAFQRPFDDNGNARPDFEFLSVGDALERQLSSRIGNPGSSLGMARYRPFSISDSMALAYRFCLDTGASRGELEQALGRSLFLSADSRTGGVLAVPSTPYRADQTGDWMERFRYDLEIPPDSATFRDLRALLVARNPVSNQSPAHYSPDDINVDGYRNDMASEQPGTGERITDVRGVAPLRKAVIQRLPLREFATPPYVGMEPLNKFAAPGPNHVSVRAVPKVSINTAGFPELWRGFWGVMCMDDNTTQHPLPPVGAVVGGSPFIGNAFKPVMREDEFGTPLRMTPDEQFATDAFEAIDERNANMMFRSSIRDVRPVSPGHLPKRFSANAQMLLRSALAAVNAEDLRDADHDVTSRLIELRVEELAYIKPTERVAVRVYGTERQPYLTEVYANTDDRDTGPGHTTNPKGYVAIELHNPYNDDIRLDGPTASDGWSIGLIDRRATPFGQLPPDDLVLTVRNLDGTTDTPWRFPTGTVVPKNGYLVLENYQPAGADTDAARYRPLAVTGANTSPGTDIPPGPAKLPPTGAVDRTDVKTLYVPNLHRVLEDPSGISTGGELVLLRPRRADGTRVNTLNSQPTDPTADQYDEIHNLRDMVPVDQFDFTGATLPKAVAPGDKVFTALHYVRTNGPEAPWRFVYPGRYDGRRPARRHQGTIQVNFGPAVEDPDNMFVEEPIERYVPQVGLGSADPVARQNQVSFTIQLAAEGWPGPNPIGPSGNTYPYGMFGRLADILQVPFIGAYTVYKPATVAPGLPTDQLYEMNSVSMDCAFAEDTDTTDDPSLFGSIRDQREQIGRFCPVFIALPNSKGTRVDDFAPSGQYPVQPQWVDFPPPPGIVEEINLAQPALRYRYRWAMDLFDHFTIQAPHNDFLPNVAPSLYKYKDGSGNDVFVRPLRPPGEPTDPPPVSNSGGVAGNSDARDLLADGKTVNESNDYAEDLQPIEGLVNINTAPWKVLAALPMVLDANGQVDVERNAELAKAIAYFRDVDDGNGRPHGPFKSLFELNEVVETRPTTLLNRQVVQNTPPGMRRAFQTAYGDARLRFLKGSPDPGVTSGDLSPDVVRGDFEERYLVLNRISNLITTRSDSFTCYVYVMGVVHDGTPAAELKVQRRTAFIADRSGVRPQRPVVRTQFFANE